MNSGIVEKYLFLNNWHTTTMAKVTGKKTYGPYKGSKQNGGREIEVTYDPKTQKTTSTNAARAKKERSLGHKLKKSEHVDHSDNNKSNNSSSNLKVMSAHDNIGKGNKNRKKK